MSAGSTKKGSQQSHDGPSAESLREIPELDLSKFRRIPNKHADRAAKNVRVIDPELVQEFPDSESVNRALREVLVTRASKSDGGDADET